MGLRDQTQGRSLVEILQGILYQRETRYRVEELPREEPRDRVYQTIDIFDGLPSPFYPKEG